MLPEDKVGKESVKVPNVDRHKQALRENLKKRKTQARDLGKKNLDGIAEGLKTRSTALKPKMQTKNQDEF